MTVILVLLCVGAYFVAGAIVDIVFEITMIHFGMGSGFTDGGRIIVYLIWPILLVMFIASFFFSAINTIVKMIVNRKNK